MLQEAHKSCVSFIHLANDNFGRKRVKLKGKLKCLSVRLQGIYESSVINKSLSQNSNCNYYYFAVYHQSPFALNVHFDVHSEQMAIGGKQQNLWLWHLWLWLRLVEQTTMIFTEKINNVQNPIAIN